MGTLTMSRLRWTAVCCLLASTASASEPEVEDLGSFLEPFYEIPSEKMITDDVEFFNQRVYIAHGYTNTKQYQQTIYYDLVKGAYGRHEDASGKPLTWPIEKTFKTHVFGDELFILDYDPIHDDSNLLRVQQDGSIKTQHPSPDAHNRDVIVFDKKIFVSVGRWDVPWPGMNWSHDDGNTWQQIDQSKVSRLSLYERFFVFKNTLYACTNSKEWKEGMGAQGLSMEQIKNALVPREGVPWLIQYTGKETEPWAVAQMNPEDVLLKHPDGNSEFGEVIHLAVPAEDELLFSSAGRLYAATSLVPAKVTPITLGTETNVVDLYTDRHGRGWALANKSQGKEFLVCILRYTGNGAVERVVEFSDVQGARCLAVADDHIYLGYNGGHLKRVRRPKP